MKRGENVGGVRVEYLPGIGGGGGIVIAMHMVARTIKRNSGGVIGSVRVGTGF